MSPNICGDMSANFGPEFTLEGDKHERDVSKMFSFDKGDPQVDGEFSRSGHVWIRRSEKAITTKLGPKRLKKVVRVFTVDTDKTGAIGDASGIKTYCTEKNKGVVQKALTDPTHATFGRLDMNALNCAKLIVETTRAADAVDWLDPLIAGRLRELYTEATFGLNHSEVFRVVDVVPRIPELYDIDFVHGDSFGDERENDNDNDSDSVSDSESDNDNDEGETNSIAKIPRAEYESATAWTLWVAVQAAFLGELLIFKQLETDHNFEVGDMAMQRLHPKFAAGREYLVTVIDAALLGGEEAMIMYILNKMGQKINLHQSLQGYVTNIDIARGDVAKILDIIFDRSSTSSSHLLPDLAHPGLKIQNLAQYYAIPLWLAKAIIVCVDGDTRTHIISAFHEQMNGTRQMPFFVTSLKNLTTLLMKRPKPFSISFGSHTWSEKGACFIDGFESGFDAGAAVENAHRTSLSLHDAGFAAGKEGLSGFAAGYASGFAAGFASNKDVKDTYVVGFSASKGGDPSASNRREPPSDSAATFADFVNKAADAKYLDFKTVGDTGKDDDTLRRLFEEIVRVQRRINRLRTIWN